MSTAVYSALPSLNWREPDASVIEGVMSYDMDQVVERYALEHDAPIGVAKELEHELKRFLALCASGPEREYGMCGPVDDLWHSFIVDTMNYGDFCQKFAGRFIHHVPGQSEESFAGYVRLLQDYERVFGQIPPIHVWPRPTRDGSLVPDCRGPAGCRTA